MKRLGDVWRYSSIPVAVRESVAEHSFWVSLYAVLIARALGADRDVQGQVAIYGLTHDMAECVTGDVVRPFKYSSPTFKKAVDEAEASMVGTLPREITSLISDAGEAVSEYVHAIVKAADFLSLHQYMRREAARGNLEIIPFYMKMTRDLRRMAEAHGETSVEVPGADPFFPGPFYEQLWTASVQVGDDCFGLRMRPGSRWARDV